ncbi:hypothetical protein TVAG_075630 [Trichomonas vaginalis G3]|uniref:Uncharacterized protein n=1 Tax=Trichomonas vaginalis (strain ATCC PRA-98 / G3) TaxID=412133 RepID=A2D9G0_TRIV3|nr:hypothetical protein TVAGG3_0287040 [Trichomonas vaginalis G3]EAY22816.1 hypothetical protein TVAG_075630 [Trichomonas vaginalis G3]KAI5526973.1 hypothetical protein TVAGG3_0287040 [Trichomonas vaginalis G3]|eukprot:XP_001583802.1 hypothetical protein [Trichomonas vaginalis G3]
MSQTAPEPMKLPETQDFPQVDWRPFLPVEGETEDQKKERLNHAVEEKNKVLKQREEFINNLSEEERLKYRENKLKKLEEKLRRKEEKLRRNQDKRSKNNKKDKKDKDRKDKKDKKSHCKYESDQVVEIPIDEFVQFKSWENSFKKKHVNAMKYNAFCEWRKANGQVPQDPQVQQENPKNQL